MKIIKDTVDIGVLVRDIEPCLKFYCETLGLPKVGELQMGGGRTQHRIQLGGAVLKWMEYKEGAPPAGPRGRTAQAGIRYITVHVDDVAAAVKELEAKGIPLVLPLTKAPSGATVAMFEDPEGNTIEIASA